MLIPILIINTIIPDSVMSKETRHTVVLILLTIQIASVITDFFQIRKKIKKLHRTLDEFEKDKTDVRVKIRNHIKN